MTTAQIALPCNATPPTGTASIPALARATLPSVSSSVATTAGLCLLDTAGRAVEISEYTVDTICNAARTTITSGVGFVVGVLPLPHFVYSGIMGATSCATGVAAALAKCSTRVLLGPAYMAVAARSGLAIQQTVGDTFGPVSSQADVLAHLIMNSAGVPSTIKADLRSYVELRSRLHSLPEHERGSINHQILRLEISLGSYRDFQDLKSALEGPADFMLRNRQRIDALAVEAAERVLARTRAFYRERVGKAVSGEVALCSAAPDSPEYIQARRALTEKITARLMSVLTEEVSDAQVSAAIRSVRGDMFSAFGTYRATWRAAISSIVAVSAATGVLPEVGRALYEFVQPVAGAAGELLEHCCSWVGEQAVACAKSGCMYIWEAFCTHFPEAAKGIKYLFALAQAGGELGSEVVEAVQNAGASVSEYVENTVAGAGSPQGPASFRIPSQPILTGEGVEWAPSCIGSPHPMASPVEPPSIQDLIEGRNPLLERSQFEVDHDELLRALQRT